MDKSNGRKLAEISAVIFLNGAAAAVAVGLLKIGHFVVLRLV